MIDKETYDKYLKTAKEQILEISRTATRNSNPHGVDLVELMKFDFEVTKVTKEMYRLYSYYDRIPSLLSEAKVGDECRVFTKTIDNQ
jgi:hypothetical protein